MTSHSCARGWRLIRSKNWFLTYTTREITSSTFERWIKHSPHRLILEKIHRAIEFDQSAWMKTYIDFNIQLWTLATNNFEKDFFKLMNNAVFGKQWRTLESIEITNEEKYHCTMMKPNFKSGIQFDKILIGCEMGKIKVVMKKPVYLGQVILDFSKIIMYEFHYDYMKRKYNEDKSQLCYMDMDSLFIVLKLRISMLISRMTSQQDSIHLDTPQIFVVLF